jgi:N-methylhydantoinase B
MTAHNVEWLELNFPLLVLFNRHITDGAGAGKFRGGAGVEYGFILHEAPENRIKGVALGVAGLRNSGQGIFGGYPGAPSLLFLQENTRVREVLGRDEWPSDPSDLGGDARPLPYCDFEVKPDDVVIMIAASGGGYGDPLERDSSLVLEDVLAGLISREAAEAVYGVVIADGSVDAAATELARSRLREERTADTVRSAPARPRQNAAHTEGAAHPLRENLELQRGADGSWICCTECGHRLCGADEEWTAAAHRVRLDPTRAGPRMAPLVGLYVLEQYSCPSCGALFDTTIADAE